MLPKVATHFLHTTSRAAAQAVQAPLRNVFQTGSSSGPNLGNWNGNSNWGGHGPGAGSAKQNSGSRYYSSFNTSGRAVSQANAVSANDGSFVQSDDNDDPLSRRVVTIRTHSGSSAKRPRIRSSSVSLSKTESLGVLQTLQLRGRSRFLHASIEAVPQLHQQPASPNAQQRPRRNSTSSSDGLDRPASPVPNFSDHSAEAELQPLAGPSARPRRNSISSTSDLEASTIELTDPALEQIDERLRSQRDSASSINQNDHSPISIDTRPTTPDQSPPVAQQPHPSSHKSRPSTPPISSQFSFLLKAKKSHNVHRIAEAVARFRSSSADATVHDFNLALEALLSTRRGESAMSMLEVYNDMIKRSVHPNSETYLLLLSSLTERNSEIEYTLRNLENKKRRIELFGRWEDPPVEKLQYQIDVLWLEQKENFSSIISLFSAAKSISDHFPDQLYIQILSSCLYRLNADAALEIFRDAELKVEKFCPQLYEILIELYGKLKDIGAAESVLSRYMAAGQKHGDNTGESYSNFAKRHIMVWNAMISAYFRCGFPEKAIGVLDQMLNSPASYAFTYADPPLPAASTYTCILDGFCAAGDTHTALTWYKRLLKQGINLQDSYLPSDKPIIPDVNASLVMVDTFAANGLISELNKLFPTFHLNTGCMFHVPRFIYSANMNALANITDPQVAKDNLDFVLYKVLPHILRKDRPGVFLPLALQYIRRGFLDEPLDFYHNFFTECLTKFEKEGASWTDMAPWRLDFVRFADAYLEVATAQDRLTANAAALVLRMACTAGLSFIPPRMHKVLLHLYGLVRPDNQFSIEKISLLNWQELLWMALRLSQGISYGPSNNLGSTSIDVPNSASPGVLSLIEDLSQCQVDITAFPKPLMEQIIQHLANLYGPQSIIGSFEQFGPAFKQVLESSQIVQSMVSGESVDTSDPRPQRPRRKLYFDSNTTSKIETLLRDKKVGPQGQAAWKAFLADLKLRKIPRFPTLGRLIQVSGRQGDMQKVHKLYGIAQEVFDSPEPSQMTLNQGWICVEDSMIIALAHAGDLDKAHAHRLRLLERNVAPSADAYGALILNVKDTTDDASNAMILFQEAVEAKVEMNLYLYNNIISKLAKARKADNALELFQKMKAQGVTPSSITYGALIGACARVGDCQSSELLFSEMVRQRNFKPRIPPYNTMMQLYTMTKPNRAKVLSYYQQLIAAGIKPAAHTYKLLLDAYGSIEPIDIDSMEAVFNEISNNPEIEVQGIHYASVINAYGCVQRDLDKAIAFFDSIPRNILDAVIFESIINVLVSHRRTDLIPEYIAKMTTAGVHMTAYIANFLIKGHAVVGELDNARDIFESLIDPPNGIAAPHNHAPHDTGAIVRVPWMEPVYREPSTWEAMVRAELGAGNRDKALDLVERLKSRQYPEAVFNRISGVMVDHSSLSPSFTSHPE